MSFDQTRDPRITKDEEVSWVAYLTKRLVPMMDGRGGSLEIEERNIRLLLEICSHTEDVVVRAGIRCQDPDIGGFFDHGHTVAQIFYDLPSEGRWAGPRMWPFAIRVGRLVYAERIPSYGAKAYLGFSRDRKVHERFKKRYGLRDLSKLSNPRMTETERGKLWRDFEAVPKEPPPHPPMGPPPAQ
jgi:hypothetical protein